MTSALAVSRTDVPDDINAMMATAKFLQGSLMMPEHLRDDPSSMFAVMLKARALNLPMSTAFDHVFVIDGRTGMSGVLMQALVLRAGYNLFLVDNSDTHATVRAERPGIGPNQEGYAYVTFTIEDAVAAELVTIDEQGKVRARSKDGKKAKPWELWTKAMMGWRATGQAARLYFADVLAGVVYLPDELGGEIDSDGRPTHRTITVDMSEDVRAALLRIERCDTLDALRALYHELEDAHLLSTITTDGATVSQVIGAKKRALQAAEGRKPKGRRKAETPTDPPADAGASNPSAEPVNAQDNTGDDESSTDGVSAEDTGNPDSGFDQLEAEPVDPAELKMTPRRRGVLKLVSEVFPDPNGAARTKFGRPLADVGTREIQEWVVGARKAGQCR